MSIKSIFKQRGFSLVEIMVAVGLVGGVSLGVTKLIQNMTQGQSQVEAKDDLRTLSQLISTILSNSESCKATFNEFIVDPATAAETLSTDGKKLDYVIRAVPVPTNMYIAGEKFGKLTITNYYLKNYDDAKKTAQLEIETKFRKSAEIEMTRSQRLALNMDIDLVAGTVTQCSSASAGEEGIWQLMDIPLMGIFYNQGSVLIGSGAADTASAIPAMAFGVDNFVYGSASIATGKNNSITSIANESAAFGTSNQLNGPSTFAIGSDNNVGTADPDGNNAIAIGYSNFVSKRYGMAIGLQNSVSVEGGLAIGNYSSSIGGNSFALGTVAEASGAYSLAFGNDITASGEKTVAIGYDSSAVGASSIVIGETSAATGDRGVAVGIQATASGTESIVIGTGTAVPSKSIAIGFPSYVNGVSSDGSIAIGANTNANNPGNTVVGFGARALSDFATAIGRGATVFGNSNKGVAIGENAASVGASLTVGGIAIGGDSRANYEGSIALGQTANSNSARGIAIGHAAVATDGFEIISIGRSASASGAGTMQSIAIGANSTITSSSNAIAIGTGSRVTMQQGAAIGMSAQASGVGGFAFGVGAQANGQYSTSIGRHVQHNVDWSTMIGNHGNAAMTGLMPSRQHTLLVSQTQGMEICTQGGAAGCSAGKLLEMRDAATGWVISSDKNIKKDFESVDKHEILERLVDLDFSTWRYKSENEKDKKHLGPMAQDFYRLFVKPLNLRGTDKNLSTNQLLMVTTIATQALNDKVKKLEEENNSLKTEIFLLREAICETNPKAKVCHQ